MWLVVSRSITTANGIPSELVFDAGPNELFVVRVAGNILGNECLGSIEYALHHFKDSVKLLAVLAHTRCGAVSAAVDTYLSPKQLAGIAFTRSLRSVVNHIVVAVRSAALSLEQIWGAAVAGRPGYRDALVELSVAVNAAATAYQLSQELPGAPVAYGVYDLATGRVGLPDGAGPKLVPVPADPAEMVDLSLALARGPVVGRLLGVDL